MLTIKELRERNAPDLFRHLAVSGLPIVFNEKPGGYLVSLAWRGGSKAAVKAAGFRQEEVKDALDWADKHFNEAYDIVGFKS